MVSFSLSHTEKALRSDRVAWNRMRIQRPFKETRIEGFDGGNFFGSVGRHTSKNITFDKKSVV